MKKTMKCYGQKTVLKEKSFITNFFDANKGTDDSLFDTCSSVKRPQDDSYIESKENIVSNVLGSPALFQYSHHDDFGKAEKESFTIKKNVKVHCNPKRAKPNRYVKKKPKLIQHLSTKFCKSNSPNWSEIYNHNLTVEKVGGHSNFPSKQYESDNKRNGTLRSKFSGRPNGFRENTNKVNIDEKDDVSIKIQTFPKNFTTANLKENSCDLDSSELFVQNTKKKAITKNRDSVHNHKQKYSTEFVNVTRRVKKNGHTPMNPKEQETEIETQLANFNGSFERGENASHIKSHNEQKENHKNTTFESSVNALSECEVLAVKQKFKNSTRTTIIQTADKTKQQNNSVFDTSLKSLEYSRNLNPEIDFPFPCDVKNPSDLLQNDCSENILNKLSAENYLVKKNSGNEALLCVVNEGGGLKESSVSSTNNTVPIINQNMNLRSLNDQTVDDFFRKKDSTVKKINYAGRKLHLTGFPPDVADNFLCSKLLEKKKKGTFVTSTPVSKSNRIVIMSTSGFESSSSIRNGKVNKSIASNSHTISSSDSEIDHHMLHTSAKVKTCKTPLQFDENQETCSGLKISTIPKHSASSKKSKSISNKKNKKIYS